MSEDIISELQKVLREMVVPDLKLLIAKIDELQRRIDLSTKAFEARLDVLYLEAETMRGEMKTFRAELNQMRAALGPQPGVRVEAAPQENAANGEEKAAGTDGPGKRWVN